MPACPPVQPTCLLSWAVLIESSISASRNAFWKSSVLQEYVTWLNRSQRARALLVVEVEIMGFGQLFYYIVTLPRLWINQGLPQTGWKRKVKVDLVFLPFVLSLPFPAALPAQHSVEVKPQEKVAVISSHCGQGADLALVPSFCAGSGPPHNPLCRAGGVSSLCIVRFSGCQFRGFTFQ